MRPKMTRKQYNVARRLRALLGGYSFDGESILLYRGTIDAGRADIEFSPRGTGQAWSRYTYSVNPAGRVDISLER